MGVLGRSSGLPERTGRTMPKRRYAPEDRARALTTAEAVGTAEAARRTGIRITTIRAWQSKARKDPEAFAIDVEIGTALLEEEPGPFSVQELERLQRRIGEAIDDALDRGKSLDAQRLTIGFGVISDKLSKRKLEAPDERGTGMAAAEARAHAALDALEERRARDAEHAAALERFPVPVPVVPVVVDDQDEVVDAEVIPEETEDEPVPVEVVDRPALLPPAPRQRLDLGGGVSLEYGDGARGRALPGSVQSRIGGRTI